MVGLNFQFQQTISSGSINRMDIACFIGLIDVRSGIDHTELNGWLYRQSWLNAVSGEAATYHRDSAADLLDVPIPVDSWQSFDRLFAWDQRRYGEQINGAGYLAAAVRAFFAQGGRLCYVIRVDATLPLNADVATRRARLPLLLPGYPDTIATRASDRSSWHGVGHLLGLPDVSIVCLPDLPELCSMQAAQLDPASMPVPAGREQFVKCAPAAITLSTDSALRQIAAPVCDNEGYRLWAAAINRCANFLARERRDVQLVAALPLAEANSLARSNPLAYLHRQGFLDSLSDAHRHGIASAFVQLCYPWLRSGTAALMTQGIEPGDGALAGLLARNALQRGAYRSIGTQTLSDIQNIYPVLSQQQQFAANEKAAIDHAPQAALIDRVCLFGFGTQQIELRSDVTTSSASAHRPASVNRIISMILRVLRQSGEDFIFENNGPALWAQITRRINGVLQSLYEVGALRGQQAQDAYFVRCDRSTMSQQDIDNGRIIVALQIDPAASIETIEVVLSLQQNGDISLLQTNMDSSTKRAVA